MLSADRTAMTERFRAVSRMLRASYDALSAGGRHTTEKGRRREDALIEVLRAYLPPRYAVSRGEIVSAKGQISKQIDVVIYDAFHSPLLQDSESSSIFPVECVYAAIEVKPHLDRSALNAAVENIQSAKALDRSAVVAVHGGHRRYHGPRQNPALFGAVFALDGGDPATSLVPRLAELHGRVPRELWLDCACILDKALIYHFARTEDTGDWVFSTISRASRLGHVELGDDTLLLFYLCLLYQLNSRELFPPDLMCYARGIRPLRPHIHGDGPTA